PQNKTTRLSIGQSLTTVNDNTLAPMAFLLQAAFADINICKSWSVYYWLGRTNDDVELAGKAIALQSLLCVENACDSVPCMRSGAVQRSVVVVVVVVEDRAD